MGGLFSGLTFSTFLEEFCRVFESPATPFCASSLALHHHPGPALGVADYTLEFRTLAAEVDWTEDALCAAFYNGLREYIKDELMRLGKEPVGLEALIKLTGNGNIDSRLQARRRERRPAPVSPEIPNSPGGPPPNSPASRAPESPSVPTPEEPNAATVCFQLQRFSFQALIDSGAEENFIDEQAAEQAGIPSEPLERPRNALAVDGRILAQGKAPTPHSPLIEPVDLSGVPPAYHDLQEVFNKDKALSLPPHRPYDCAIELLPDAPLPSSRLYNLTRPEQEAMEGYINDSMAAGIIRPSTSPVGAGNLPDHQLHVRQVLQRLLENRLFVKKEKCEFHASQVDFLGFIIKEGCVQADPAKVRAVAEWPIPTNRKLLQRFLGFANFYRRFIRNYSQEAGAPDSSHLPVSSLCLE
ncbi:hypothetical protein L3Q82_025448 [Scortum barcoo]|uniref:Uncharacterized protein n=1 Tax=Scortum barcoo TaxID=214431 RepID=A0ACB8WKV8_9TELE|nr:hypothetical protein L3Q82_025448 [Scortum barcoo]